MYLITFWSLGNAYFYNNYEAAFDFNMKSSFNAFAFHQVITRQIVKTEFLLGLAQTLVDAIDVGEYQHIQAKMAEIITGLETMKALLESRRMMRKQTNGVICVRVSLRFVWSARFS